MNKFKLEVYRKYLTSGTPITKYKLFQLQKSWLGYWRYKAIYKEKIDFTGVFKKYKFNKSEVLKILKQKSKGGKVAEYTGSAKQLINKLEKE